MTKCVGCGITLQTENKSDVGYTPDIKNVICERCFKLKNYNVLTNTGVKIDNEKLIEKINKLGAFVFFLTDFINLDSNVIKYYKKIKGKKVMVLTKADIIPKNIKYNKLTHNIKNLYEIKEDVILTSSKKKLNISTITNLCLENKKVIFVGFTNAGKSSLINSLIGSDITVSNSQNTTQEIIKLNASGITIYDAPGLMDNVNRENIPKASINPRSYQFPSKHYLSINGIKLNVKENSNFTIYVGNEVKILRRKETHNVECNIIVPKNSDVVLKGLGFIKFSKTTLISLSSNDFEIRPSIIGDSHD